MHFNIIGTRAPFVFRLRSNYIRRVREPYQRPTVRSIRMSLLYHSELQTTAAANGNLAGLSTSPGTDSTDLLLHCRVRASSPVSAYRDNRKAATASSAFSDFASERSPGVRPSAGGERHLWPNDYALPVVPNRKGASTSERTNRAAVEPPAVVGHLFARLARAGRRHRIAARPYPRARFPRAPFPRKVSLISMEPDGPPLLPPATPPLESRPGGAVARGITAPQAAGSLAPG